MSCCGVTSFAEQQASSEKKDGKDAKKDEKDAIPGWVMPVAISVSSVIILGLIVMLIVRSRRRRSALSPTREEFFQKEYGFYPNP